MPGYALNVDELPDSIHKSHSGRKNDSARAGPQDLPPTGLDLAQQSQEGADLRIWVCSLHESLGVLPKLHICFLIQD